MKIAIETGLHAGATLDWAGAGELVVGSSDRSDLQLGDEGVLGRHFALRPVPGAPGGVQLVALEGGLVLDGQAVRPGEARSLPAQAVAELGPVRLRLSGTDAAQSIPATAIPATTIPATTIPASAVRVPADKMRGASAAPGEPVVSRWPAPASGKRSARPPRRVSAAWLLAGGLVISIVSIWQLLPARRGDSSPADRALLLNAVARPAQSSGAPTNDAQGALGERLAATGLATRIRLAETAAGLLASGNVDDADFAAWQDIKSWYAKMYRNAPALADEVRVLSVRMDEIGIGALESGPGMAVILASGERFEVGQSLPDGSKILCVDADEAVLLREGRQVVVRHPNAPPSPGACSAKPRS